MSKVKKKETVKKEKWGKCIKDKEMRVKKEDRKRNNYHDTEEERRQK